MNQKIIPAYFFVISLFLVAGFASMIAIAKNDNSTGNDKDKKTESTSKNENKKNNQESQDIRVELKNYKKADSAKGETNAQIHKEKTTQVIEKLGEEESKNESLSVTINASVTTVNIEKNNEAKKKIAQVMAEQKSSQEAVIEAMEEVESEGVAKKFFLGPDYKNLGQLRSELVHNRNQIRQLNQAIITLSQSGEDTTALQEQLVILSQERERIKSIITANQDSFSLLGWVSRFLANYEEIPINEEEENELADEVKETIDNADDETTVTETNINTNTTTTPVETNTESETTTVNTTTGDDQIDTTVILTR